MSGRRLSPTCERSSIRSMISLRKSVVCLLVLILPLSSWTNAASVCDAGRSTTVQEIATVAHAHHDPAGNVEHGVDHHSDRHHQNVQGGDALATECPCCDDCAALCSTTGGSTVANASILVDSLFDGRDQLIPHVVEFRRRPPPQSLFRPPIPQA